MAAQNKLVHHNAVERKTL